MDTFYERAGVTIYCGDALEVLGEIPDQLANTCVTSPPYWGLRDYSNEGQIGLERTPNEYVEKMVDIFREVRRVLRDDGTVWLNLGDSYHSGDRGGYRKDSHRWEKSPIQRRVAGTHMEAISPNRLPQEGLKDKDLVGIPWRVAFAFQADGWYLRSDIIWQKPNPMPESVTDRPTKAHEYIFLLSKSKKYYYDAEAIAESVVEPRGSGNLDRQYGDDVGRPGSHLGRSVPWKPQGKHSKTEPQDSGRRMTENVAKARAEGKPHDSPFGCNRNKRTVWTVTTKPYSEAHFAVFPPDLIEPCIKAGCPEGGVVLDPFLGSGTTALVSLELGCKCVGIELNAQYCEMAKRRIENEVAQKKLF